MTRKTNDRLDELEAGFEHLQERIDGLRDKVYEQMVEYTPTMRSEYFWNKFEDVLAWCQKYDANTEEWKKLNHLAWELMDKYLEALLQSTLWGEKDDDAA